MSGRLLRSTRPSSKVEEPTESLVNLPVQQLNHGDVLWSRINGESWWPVQVADEKCVPCKPKKTKKDQILVRLYGTFEHIYVDPANCALKIEKMFGQENSSIREVFQRFLEKDLTLMKSGGSQLAAVVPESKEISKMEKDKDEAPGGRRQTKGKLKRTLIADNSLLDGSSANPKPAKQAKVATSEAIAAVKASSEVGITKPTTRRGTFKARNVGTSGIEAAKETAILNVGASTISSLDDKDLSVLHKASESNCLKQDCGRILDVNNKIEISDAKDIKKLVAKIVKEVAEKARNEALKNKGAKICPEKSRKKASEIENMEQHIPRRAKNNDVEAHGTEGAIDDTRVEIAGPSEDKLSNGSSCVENDERAKDIYVELPSAAEQESNETLEIDGVHRSEGCLKVTNRGNKSQSNSVKRDDEVDAKDVSSEKMGSPGGATKCFLSRRRTRVMQSLGLIAPSGSPFCRNGLIKSSAAMNSQT